MTPIMWGALEKAAVAVNMVFRGGRTLHCFLCQQKAAPAKKDKKVNKEKKKEEQKEDDSSRDIGEPEPEKKAPHPLAILDKEAKSPFVGDVWKKVLIPRLASLADLAPR